MKPWPLVLIESPYAGNLTRNKSYARAALLNCIERGEAPVCSHLLYTQVLNDLEPVDRTIGILIGHQFLRVVNYVAVYDDLGISEGMRRGIDLAHSEAVEVQYRKLPGWVMKWSEENENVT